LLGFSVKVFAGLPEALALLTSGDFKGAEVVFRKNLETATGEDAAKNQFYIGWCLDGQMKYAEAVTEYAKVKDLKDASAYALSQAQYSLATSLKLQKRYAEAIVEFGKVKDITDAYPDYVTYSELGVYDCQEKTGNDTDAQIGYKDILLTKDLFIDAYKQALIKIDKVALGKTEYLQLLDTLLLNTDATSENAEFLGKVKSEIEKLK